MTFRAVTANVSNTANRNLEVSDGAAAVIQRQVNNVANRVVITTGGDSHLCDGTANTELNGGACTVPCTTNKFLVDQVNVFQRASTSAVVAGACLGNCQVAREDAVGLSARLLCWCPK